MRTDLITTAQAAEELGQSKATLKPHLREFKTGSERQAIIEAGRLPGKKLGQTFAIAREDLEEFKKRRRMPGRPTAGIWKDMGSGNSIDVFAALQNLNPESLRPARTEALILPNNKALISPREDHNAFAQYSKEILFALREGGVEAQFYGDAKVNRQLVLASADIILPILLFFSDPAVNVGLNILSAWIYNNWPRPRSKKTALSVRAEYLRVDRGDGTVVRHCQIEGLAPEVGERLIEEAGLFVSPPMAPAAHRKRGRRKTAKTHKRSTGKSAGRTLPSPTKLVQQSRSTESSAECALSARRSAKLLIQQAQELFERGRTDESESLYRRSLVKLREAHLWQPEDASHVKLLHEVGNYVHSAFPHGCQFALDEGQYMVRCPVLLSHSRGGFSRGSSEKVICSICGLDILECSHIKGNKYDNVLASRHGNLGVCNICASAQVCDHEEGMRYHQVRAFGIVAEIHLDHFAFVEHPRDPLCAVNAYSLTESRVLQDLPEGEADSFVYGRTPLYCHHCVICEGA
jgi:hypothetical protein